MFAPTTVGTLSTDAACWGTEETRPKDSVAEAMPCKTHDAMNDTL